MSLARTLIVLTIGLIVSNNSFSQQEPRSTFFWNNYMHTNPAMTGAVYKHHANAQWRSQWVNQFDETNTLWANYAMKLDKINSGIGVSYEYDWLGFGNRQTALFSYAYHIPIKNLFLSLGASAGIKTLKTTFFNDGFRSAFQCDFGVALRAEKWNVGLSVTQLNGATFKTPLFNLKDAQHIWLFADYAFKLGEKWKLTPRVQSYSDFVKINSSVALVASFKENLWFGATASIPSEGGIYAVGPMIGYDIVGKFRIGYTYEFNLIRTLAYYPGEQNSVSLVSGTHEIILSYQLK